MAVTNTPAFPQARNTSSCVCTAAKTTYNDSTNAVLLFTAGDNGSAVNHIGALPRATVTPTQLQLYRSPDSGTTLYLCGSALMAAYTMQQTTAVPTTALLHEDGSFISELSPLGLKPNERLYAAIGVALAGGVVFTADGVNY